MQPLLWRAGRIVCLSIAGFLLLSGAAVCWKRDSIVLGVQDWWKVRQETALKKEEEHRAAALKKAILSQVTELPLVDEVAVLRLADKPLFQDQKPFSKTPHGTLMYEAKKIVLTGQEAQPLASLWRSESVIIDGTGCHEPHHALHFYRNGTQIGEAIVCFTCGNAEVTCAPFGKRLIGLDSTLPQYWALKTRLESLVGPAR